MKKLLLVLLVVALAAFLLVGCTPGGTVTPVTPVAGVDCPTIVAVSGEVAIGGKNYIQGGDKKTITVTFAVATAPISVYVGEDIKAGEVPSLADEMVMYTTDNKVYTGTYTFHGACETDYIYVETCGTCNACKYPYTVDSEPPTAEIQICAATCAAACGGCELSFTSTVGTICTTLTPSCDDDCSGFATWNIDIYDQLLGDCCTTACGGILIDSGSGTACPVDWSTACLSTDTGDEVVYAYVTLADKVGNETMFGYTITQKWTGDTCDQVTIANIIPAADQDCLDTGDWVPCPPCTPVIIPQG